MAPVRALTRHNSPWFPFVIFSVGIKCHSKKGYLDKGHCLSVLRVPGAGKQGICNGKLLLTTLETRS